MSIHQGSGFSYSHQERMLEPGRSHSITVIIPHTINQAEEATHSPPSTRKYVFDGIVQSCVGLGSGQWLGGQPTWRKFEAVDLSFPICFSKASLMYIRGIHGRGF